MLIDNITNITKYLGILSPRGEKYVPSSIDEYNQISNKCGYYQLTGESNACSEIIVRRNLDIRRTYHYFEFFYEYKQYYIDIDTFISDIRQLKLNQLES